MEVASTVLAIMQKLHFKHPHRLVWQSKVGPLPWLSPSTDKAIRAYTDKGIRNFVVIPIAFVNEHIETLHELDIEYGFDLAKEVRSREETNCCLSQLCYPVIECCAQILPLSIFS